MTANHGSFPLQLLSLPCSGLVTLVFPQFLECFKLLTSQDPHPTGFGLDDTPLNHFPAPLIWIRSLLQYLQWWRRALRTNREVTINFPNPLILYFKIGNWLWNLDGSFILIMPFNLLPGVWRDIWFKFCKNNSRKPHFLFLSPGCWPLHYGATFSLSDYSSEIY